MTISANGVWEKARAEPIDILFLLDSQTLFCSCEITRYEQKSCRVFQKCPVWILHWTGLRMILRMIFGISKRTRPVSDWHLCRANQWHNYKRCAWESPSMSKTRAFSADCKRKHAIRFKVWQIKKIVSFYIASWNNINSMIRTTVLLTYLLICGSGRRRALKRAYPVCQQVGSGPIRFLV